MKISKKTNDTMEAKVIYKNNHVITIYEACTCCYDINKETNYLNKKEYIKKRVLAGHDSILEHGRLALKISNINDASLIAEVTTYEYSKYLEFYSVHKEDNTFVLIVNGSMRAFKHFFCNITEDDYMNNILVRKIHTLLLENTVSELYGYPDKWKYYGGYFVDIEGYPVSTDYVDPYTPTSGLKYQEKYYKSIDVQTASKNNTNCVKSIRMGIDLHSLHKLRDDPDISTEVLLNIISSTVIFENMSRTATHQLVRHRNAITQESQRYVDSSNASFTIPVPDYKGKKYRVTTNGVTNKMTLDELAVMLTGIYIQLTEQGLKKEEARAFLPSNINCRRLYMTFSFYNLIQFLKLRTDEHAQYEIRMYAIAVENCIKDCCNLLDIDYDTLKGNM